MHAGPNLVAVLPDPSVVAVMLDHVDGLEDLVDVDVLVAVEVVVVMAVVVMVMAGVGGGGKAQGANGESGGDGDLLQHGRSPVGVEGLDAGEVHLRVHRRVLNDVQYTVFRDEV